MNRILTILLLIISKTIFSQGIAVNNLGAAADSSAILDINSSNRGLLIPRLTTTERNAIVSPANSLMIFNTTTRCFEFYESGSWYNMGCACTPPDIPIAGAATDIQSTSFTANWDSASGAIKYYIDVATDSNFTSFFGGYNNFEIGDSVAYVISGLSCNTTYYYRVRSWNNCNYSGSSNYIITVTGSCFTCGSTLLDIRDLKTYNTVQIGSQCWMAENLNYGTQIAGSIEQANNSTIEKYCHGDNAANCITYGALYQWAEAIQYLNGATNTTTWSPVPSGNIQGICPAGWHIPSHDEWTTLERAICTSGACISQFPYDSTTTGWCGSDEGGKLKETGIVHWNSPNTGATNSSGFTALPAGFRSPSLTFGGLGINGDFWSSTDFNSTDSWARVAITSETRVYRCNYLKTIGFPVRCLKD